jgi:small subunit ribosomal protein S21
MAERHLVLPPSDEGDHRGSLRRAQLISLKSPVECDALMSAAAIGFTPQNHREMKTRRTLLQVLVRDNDVDKALRILKRKMQREGVFREMKRRRSYEKPSERKTREKSDAIRRHRKVARKQAIREGLLPAPPRKVPTPRAPALPSLTSTRTERPQGQLASAPPRS